MRNTYETHQQKTTTEHQIPDLQQVQTNAKGFKRINRYQPLPLSENNSVTSQHRIFILLCLIVYATSL